MRMCSYLHVWDGSYGRKCECAVQSITVDHFMWAFSDGPAHIQARKEQRKLAVVAYASGSLTLFSKLIG